MNETLPQQLTFDPSRYSKAVLDLILSTAESHRCTPSEAEVILLNQLAKEAA